MEKGQLRLICGKFINKMQNDINRNEWMHNAFHEFKHKKIILKKKDRRNKNFN